MAKMLETQELPKILASCDDFGSFSSEGAGSYLAVMTKPERRNLQKARKRRIYLN